MSVAYKAAGTRHAKLLRQSPGVQKYTNGFVPACQPLVCQHGLLCAVHPVEADSARKEDAVRAPII